MAELHAYIGKGGCRRNRSNRSLRLILSGAGVMAVLSGSATDAHAFGLDEHELITTTALSCEGGAQPPACFEDRALNKLAGTNAPFGFVGAPDANNPLNPSAHCDNADYFSFGYPRSRFRADKQLDACRQRINELAKIAKRRASNLLDKRGRLERAFEYSLDCHDLRDKLTDPQKCQVLRPFGELLHPAQDFYSHSNWADEADPSQPTSVTNPPGLHQSIVAPVLDLTIDLDPVGSPAWQQVVPVDLTTGCFELDCRGRITHEILNKDTGTFVEGSPVDGTTPRGMVGMNFELAFALAVRETQRQWNDLRQAILTKYRGKRGTRIVCALTRDHPKVACAPDPCGAMNRSARDVAGTCSPPTVFVGFRGIDWVSTAAYFSPPCSQDTVTVTKRLSRRTDAVQFWVDNIADPHFAAFPIPPGSGVWPPPPEPAESRFASVALIGVGTGTPELAMTMERVGCNRGIWRGFYGVYWKMLRFARPGDVINCADFKESWRIQASYPSPWSRDCERGRAIADAWHEEFVAAGGDLRPVVARSPQCEHACRIRVADYVCNEERPGYKGRFYRYWRCVEQKPGAMKAERRKVLTIEEGRVIDCGPFVPEFTIGEIPRGC